MSTRTNTNFVYDPIRSGYDTNSWRTISGAPAVGTLGRLVIDNGSGIDASTIHYADFCKGDVSFNINIPSTPAGGDSRYFGVSAPNTSAYIRFYVGSDLYCQTSDGVTTTTSSALTWDSTNWNGINVVFTIRWEAGTARFFIQGTQVYSVSDASVPYGPLSLYLFDNSTSPMTVGDINVRGAQSLVMTPKTSDSSSTSSGGTISVNQSVTVTENVSIYEAEYTPTFNESVTITESITMSVMANEALNESITVTDVSTISISNYVPEVNDTVTLTEDLTMYHEIYTLIPSVFEDVTVSDVLFDIGYGA